MRFVKPSYEIMNMTGDMAVNIEKIARTCYKSESKITEGSAKKMVGALIRSQHEAMLEHESFFFELSTHQEYTAFVDHITNIRNAGYTCMLRTTYFNRGIISGNVRMWRDFLRISTKLLTNGIVNMPVTNIEAIDKDYEFFFGDIGEPAYKVIQHFNLKRMDKELLNGMERIVHYPITVKFICDRGIANEIVRHRVSSFAQESTRYCSYSKDQFSGQISCICPFEFKEGSEEYNQFKEFCELAEKQYMAMLSRGIKPQIARNVLPLALKTELCMTATIEGWRHFFELRACDATGPAHPQIKELAIPLLKELKEKYPEDFPMTPVVNPAEV